MICYKIIETHQGNVFIESEVNKGTTVEVTLLFVHFKINIFFTEIFKKPYKT